VVAEAMGGAGGARRGRRHCVGRWISVGWQRHRQGSRLGFLGCVCVGGGGQ
jgi:hypothetical protein